LSSSGEERLELCGDTEKIGEAEFNVACEPESGDRGDGEWEVAIFFS